MTGFFTPFFLELGYHFCDGSAQGTIATRHDETCLLKKDKGLSRVEHFHLLALLFRECGWIAFDQIDIGQHTP